MRIKLNLQQLIPNRSPTIYWLYVDLNYILLIKQLKDKVQKVLKETRDIDLCFDDVPFLDEDDIHVINENEEISVQVKEKANYDEPNYCKTGTKESGDSILCNIHLSAENSNYKPVNGNESSTSSLLPKKRVRKRTHKKNKRQIEPVEPIENDNFSVQAESYIMSSEKPCKIHKRFKLANEEITQGRNDSVSESSDEEILHVTREIFRCNSSSLNSEKKNNTILPVREADYSCKANGTKVPVFVRGKINSSTPKNITENDSYNDTGNDKTTGNNQKEDTSIIDWKNMNALKIQNISELQICDLLQFKILSMNELGEPEMSSVITARLEHIIGKSLLIQVLSGIKEFIISNQKFRMGDEEDSTTLREVEFDDLFEVYKLT